MSYGDGIGLCGTDFAMGYGVAMVRVAWEALEERGVEGEAE